MLITMAVLLGVNVKNFTFAVPLKIRCPER